MRPASDDPFAFLRSGNWQTRDAWDRCSRHRQRLQSLLFSASAPGGRLCVCGAGNCNDLDLRALLEHFRQVHLADIDRDAVETGIARQNITDLSRLVIHAPCDLAGIAGVTGAADPVKHLASHDPGIEERFDAVLSSGLLTQMFQSLVNSGLPIEAALALRRRHIGILIDLAQPGGAFVLATDVVSTATAPALRACPEDDLSELLAQLIESRNFFTGANPAAIWKELTENPGLVSQLSGVESHAPWLWPVSSQHDYLVWAVTGRTKLIPPQFPR